MVREIYPDITDSNRVPANTTTSAPDPAPYKYLTIFTEVFWQALQDYIIRNIEYSCTYDECNAPGYLVFHIAILFSQVCKDEE